MGAKNIEKGQKIYNKPAVAYSSEDRAKKNIQSKLDALSYVWDACVADQENSRRIFGGVEGNTGDRVLLPKSQRQFLLWDDLSLLTDVGYKGEPFHRIGNGTLNRYAGMHGDAKKLIASIWGELRAQKEWHTESTESRLRKALQRERVRTSALERDIVDLRRQLKKETDERVAAQQKIKDFGHRYGHLILAEVGKDSAKIVNISTAGRSRGK
ncbi:MULTISPECIES: hypothetical protein [Cupriavidus]|uniref:hypothetical protein n=1 Tax=Cupriavidus pauculus TaxID=82633 RepID=UPI001C9330E1|nr:hypothetical protein [Cupriavidus pauculus]MBY4731760.1 hypothetical protein [Cupriavidus pauculus]